MSGIAFINGKQIEWNDQKINIAGAPVVNVTDVRFGVKTAKKHLFAGGNTTIGIQSGNKEPTGSVTLLAGDVNILNEAAVTAGGDDLCDLVFDIVITYAAKGIRPLQVFTLVGCEISEFEYGWAQNADSMPVKLPFLYKGLLLG